jgi:hypothetical protein
MSKDLARLFAEPFLAAYHRIGGAVPRLVAAFVLLLLGMFLARALRALVEGLFGTARLDEHTSRIGLNELLARLGLGKSPTAVASFVAHWFVLVVFIVSAAHTLDMTAVSDVLERFVSFLPSAVAAALILFGGMLFARLVSHVLANAAAANSIRGGGLLAGSAHVVAIGYSVVAAFEQLGARPSLVVSTIQILLGSLGLALAIAFGLGAKDLAADWLRGLAQKPRA